MGRTLNFAVVLENIEKKYYEDLEERDLLDTREQLQQEVEDTKEEYATLLMSCTEMIEDSRYDAYDYNNDPTNRNKQLPPLLS